ncbi:craniofacial development protein 2-like [Palaemon carinicauda]|uniref:craniofacial development protein 2-like n=1 Tax=Palaemon carinicauda TaxID=392227 RepID=UPI0035B66E10
MDTTKKDTIPARSSPGSTRTVSSVAHQGGRDKCTNGATSPPKIRGRDNVTIATWNVRTLAQTRKLQELTHELEKYTWHVVGLCEAYAPTTDHDDDAVEAFYSQLQETIDKVDKNDILIIQGDWNAKVGKDALKDWKEFCGPPCNDVSNERGLRLLEFARYNNAVLANTLGEHKASRCWTWHAPNGIHILVQNRFRSGIKRATTRTFPGADVSSDHDLVFVNFKLRLKTIKKPKNTRVKFSLDRLKDPNIAESFKATVGGEFAPLLTIEEDHSTETLTA